MRRYISALLWCQECGAMVTGPQPREWKKGDTVTVIRGREVRWQGESCVVRDNAPAIVLSENADGQYIVQAGGVAVRSLQSCLVEFPVWPGETAEEPVSLGSGQRAERRTGGSS